MSSKPRSTGTGIVAAALKAGTKVAATVAAASTGADPITAEIAGELAAEQSVAMFGLFQEKLAVNGRPS